MNSSSELLQQLSVKPVNLDGEYFLHINNPDKAYVVTSGSVHVFCWVFENNLPTRNKCYLGSFRDGDILLSGLDYMQDDKSTGFYVILDHDATLVEANIDDIFALRNQYVADKINNYLSHATAFFSDQTKLENEQFAQSGMQQVVEQESWLFAKDEDEILWLKPHQSGGIFAGTEQLDDHNFSLISKTVFVSLKEGQTYDCHDTLGFLNNDNIHSALLIFDNWIKGVISKILDNIDVQKKDNFSYLQNMQASHLNNTFSHLYDSYYGDKNITPETVVIDESLGINRIIGELCKQFNMKINPQACKTIESLDYCDLNDVEHALKVYRINSRKVVLEKDWNRNDRWVLLSRLVDSQQTVILSQYKKHYYYFDAKENQWIKVDESNIGNIDENALMLYRPLPEEPIKSGFDLFKLSLFFSKADLKVVLIAALLISTLNLVTPVVIGRLIAEALPSNQIGLIYGYILAMLSAAAGVGLFQFVSGIAMSRIESKSFLDLHSSIWSRLLQLPMSFFDKFSVGDLSDRANMIESIYAIWSAAVTAAILSMFSMVAILALLFYYSPSLAIVSSLLFVVVALVLYWFLTSVSPSIQEVYKYKGIINNIVFQTLSGINKFRIASKENTMLSLWANIYNKIVVNNRKYMISSSIMQSFFQLLPLISSIIIFSFTYYFLYYKASSDFNLGDFISFNAAFGQLTGALISISSVLSSVIMVKPMMKRIMPILEQEVETSGNKVVMSSLQGSININNLFFRYNSAMPMVLKDMSLKIEPGEYVAIVGSSGSGKSTIFRILMGFEKVQSGSVLIDGININDVEMSSLRKSMGTVLQDGAIIPGSILENITSGNNNISEDDVWHALELAGIKNEVKKMPMGVHTIISENGSSISGGQLQRLIIARALVSKPSMLLLDEATSAMDNVVQRLVQNTLESMDITRVVIAHRLSTIKNADRIYVLDKGKIVESGSYEQLMKNEGYFSELVARQQ